MTKEQKYYGESKILGEPKRAHKFKLGKQVVGQENVKDQAITPRKFSVEVETEWLLPILNAKCCEMMKQIMEIRQLVTSYASHGLAVTNNFGSNEDIGISQKAFTDAIRELMEMIHNITGEPESGVCAKISPDVFFSETWADVLVTVTAGSGVFEKVKIFVNDELRIEKSYTTGFVDHLKIDETSMVTTVVQIMGVEYIDNKVVTKVFPFFIGSSAELWSDVMTVENAQTYKGHLRGTYDFTVNNDGDKIYVIFPKRLSCEAIRIDMNGFEIPTTKQVHGDYTVYESVNEYQAGRYNLDITDNCNCNCNNE